jgi:alpha-beta hydrolase superfamily lysophospholipase
MATFVLVHGAWHGAWCWRRVARMLTQAGHEVFTPTLTGVGERSHLLKLDINLDTHILDVVNEMRWQELNNVVLVGHSYAGMVVTGVVEHSRGAWRHSQSAVALSITMDAIDFSIFSAGFALTYVFFPIRSRARVRVSFCKKLLSGCGVHCASTHARSFSLQPESCPEPAGGCKSTSASPVSGKKASSSSENASADRLVALAPTSWSVLTSTMT